MPPSMKIPVQESTFIPAPEGLHRAVCVDLVDLGTQNTTFGPKDKVRFVFELDPDTAGLHPEHGTRFCLFVSCNRSLHEESTMGKMLRRWRGRDFTPKEAEGFDVESVVGAPALINVVHNESDGKIYANADPVMKLTKDREPLKPSGEYEREYDRENSRDVRSPNYSGEAASKPTATNGNGSGTPDNFAAIEDDLPF